MRDISGSQVKGYQVYEMKTIYMPNGHGIVAASRVVRDVSILNVGDCGDHRD